MCSGLGEHDGPRESAAGVYIRFLITSQRTAAIITAHRSTHHSPLQRHSPLQHSSQRTPELFAAPCSTLACCVSIWMSGHWPVMSSLLLHSASAPLHHLYQRSLWLVTSVAAAFFSSCICSLFCLLNILAHSINCSISATPLAPSSQQ